MNICDFYICVIIGAVVLAVDEYFSDSRNNRRDR